MTKIKVSEATPLQLDWLVTTIEEPMACKYGVADWREQRNRTVKYSEYVYRWSSSWMQGGPIIERDALSVVYDYKGRRWCAAFWHEHLNFFDPNLINGPTPLTAAMRCFVASKLGDEVEVPEELLT